jgi:membrane fusion protein (multidrug efflux system)
MDSNETLLATETAPVEAPKAKSRAPLFLVLLLLVAGGAGWYYWQQNRGIETTDNAQLDGNVESVRASVTAYLDKIYFQDNQQVKQGDTLLRFNSVALRARVQQATAMLANAQAALRASGSTAAASADNAVASVQLAQSGQQSLASAQANIQRAQEEYDRTVKLLQIKGATQQQLEAARTQLAVTRADYAAAQSRQLSSATTARGLQATSRSQRAQIGTAQALVKQREAELALAEEDLRHAIVLAPCSGIVSKRAVQQGQFVSAGQSLCAVVDQQHLWVTANVKETQLGTLRPGQPVEVEVDAYPGLRLEGRVASFGGATGAKFSLLPPDNASGNFVKVVQRFPVRIELEKTQPTAAGSAPLYPGLSTFVKINTRSNGN